MPGLPDLSSGISPITWLSLLVTALGLSSAAGLRAYLPLLAVAVGSDIPTGDGGHLVPLSTDFKNLGIGSPWLIAIFAVLAVAEFAADKVPLLDHVSDAIHTVLRPVAGAVVMAATSNPLSEYNIYLAGLVGALLALSVHGVKAATRPVVTATTVGAGNPVVSIFEDIVNILLIVLSVLAPFLALLFVIVVALLIARPLVRGLRRLFGGRSADAALPGRTRGGRA
jgi:uncharacterized membrane protein